MQISIPAIHRAYERDRTKNARSAYARAAPTKRKVEPAGMAFSNVARRVMAKSYDDLAALDMRNGFAADDDDNESNADAKGKQSAWKTRSNDEYGGS